MYVYGGLHYGQSNSSCHRRTVFPVFTRAHAGFLARTPSGQPRPRPWYVVILPGPPPGDAAFRRLSGSTLGPVRLGGPAEQRADPGAGCGPLLLLCLDTSGSANRGIRVESRWRRKDSQLFPVWGSPANRGFLGGKPPVGMARPWGRVHPADCPLSALFGYFLPRERKYPAGGPTWGRKNVPP